MTIEQFVIQYLSGAEVLAGIPVSGSIPHSMPTVFVTVEQTASNRADLISSAEIVVESWAGSRAGAADLNEAVKGLMDALAAEPEISQSSLDTDYNYPDLETNHPRYHAVYNIVYFL